MTLQRAVLLILCMSIAACTTHVQRYDGPPREKGEIALLKEKRGFLFAAINVMSIDGKEVSRSGVAFEFELLPGPHSISAEYHLEGTGHSMSRAYAKFVAEAGQVYEIRGEISGRAWRAVIVDVKTGKAVSQ